MTDSEQDPYFEALVDACLYGTGYIRNGQHVPFATIHWPWYSRLWFKLRWFLRRLLSFKT